MPSGASASSATSRAQPAAQPPAQPAAQPAAQQSPLLSEPTTADALFDAVVLMVDLARPEPEIRRRNIEIRKVENSASSIAMTEPANLPGKEMEESS